VGEALEHTTRMRMTRRKRNLKMKLKDIK